MSQQHLLAELARIDLLVRHHVARWQLAGQDPSDDFRGLRITDDDAGALAARPFGTSWGQMAQVADADARAYARAFGQATAQAAMAAQVARQQGQPSRLEHLARVFGLDRFALDVFLIALAPALDNRYERLYAYLQDDVTRKRPSINLALDLLCDAGPERLERLTYFSDSAPLFNYHLLERITEPGVTRPTLITQTLLPDETVIAWLLQDYHPHPAIAAHTRLLGPAADATDALLAAEAWTDLQTVLADSSSAPPIVVMSGVDRAGQLAAARQLATHRRQPLLQVHVAGLVDADTPAEQVVGMALRDARMTGAIPLLTGWDAALVEGAPSASTLDLLCNFEGLLLVSGRAAWQARGLPRQRTLLWVEFAIPSYHQRLKLWERFLGEAHAGIETEALEGLAAQFFLTSDQIRDSVATARDMASLSRSPLRGDDLFASARAHSSSNLSSLARKITPRYQWTDIILPDDQITILHEIVNTVRGRPQVLEAWGVGEKLAASAGVTILFAGQPGTGKTMAAEVIATELGLDLYKIDLSSIVSKYIGETEKNLERIFSEAQSSNAILFFDEADAIFGKRSEVKDAHDRYANIEVSYLLQRMEQYDGVTILATNLRANLDDAFTRRLQFALDFPFPDESYRLRIWETLFPPSVPRSADVDLAAMARRFKLPGGNIRNIIVSAAYLAAADGGRVTMEHLLHGARREMQKMGRLIKEHHLDPQSRNS